jgi:hypothetical protein
MEVKKIPPPLADSTFDIIGCTQEEAIFLRDLMATFAASCDGYPDFHKRLYEALNQRLPARRVHRFTMNNYNALTHRTITT